MIIKKEGLYRVEYAFRRLPGVANNALETDWSVPCCPSAIF